jgi:hypothetical protein
MLLLCAAGSRAEALAPSGPAGGCVAISVDVLSETGGQALYRIVFVNRCAAPRSFYWCAENPGTPVPAAVVCPKGQGFPAEPRQAILRRKEFQWHLPRGSRIRYHDCAEQDVPTTEFGCAAP